MMRPAITWICATVIPFLWTAVSTASDWKFTVKQAAGLRKEPFSGRVYLYFQRGEKEEPRLGMDWFHPLPFLALDVDQWQPDHELRVSAATPHLLSFPKPLGELDLTGCRVQAIARFNPLEREVGTGTGNGFSPPVTLGEHSDTKPIELVIDQLVPETPFPKLEHCRELVVKSNLLSQFHERDVNLKASVQLPASYATSPERRYPVIYIVPGFGGTHADVPKTPTKEKNQDGVEFLRVTLDPSCPLGHHVFADSANNGPVGQALIDELIPAVDREFRTVSASTARFLTGHSSGGWSTLWLQTTYPEVFGGTWSTSPDPVDFQDFQRVNLYQPSSNLYYNEFGQRRPIARDGSQVLLWTIDFCDMETGLGDGGQMRSFEAVFSPRGLDLQPQKLWDRRTGAIDRTVAEYWMRYDIRLRLVQNWPTLRTKLAGKLNVFMGSEDTFYLEGATQRLKTTLTELGSDAVVVILPGKNHFNLFSDGLNVRIRKEMTEAFLRSHKP